MHHYKPGLDKIVSGVTVILVGLLSRVGAYGPPHVGNVNPWSNEWYEARALLKSHLND